MPKYNHRAKVFKLLADSDMSVSTFLPTIKREYEKAKADNDFDMALPLYNLLGVMELAIEQEEKNGEVEEEA